MTSRVGTVPQVHSIFVGTARVVFAAIGFSLSVLAIALAIVVPAQRLGTPIKHASPRIISRERSVYLSDKHRSKSSTPPSSTASTSKNTESDNSSKVSIASHFHCESSSSPRQHDHVYHAEESLPHSPKPRPTTNSLFRDNPVTLTPSSSESSFESYQGFRLRKLRPTWGEKRSDNQLTRRRCPSTPFHTSPVDRSPTPHDTTWKPFILVQRKPSKNLRKISSVPSGMRLKSCPLEKKKPRPSRTQPYEAPYFFPPPMPVEKTSSRGKLPRSHTLPPPPRQRSPSLIPPLVSASPAKSSTVGGSLAPHCQ